MGRIDYRTGRTVKMAALIQLVFLVFCTVAGAVEEGVTLFFFWGEGCPHCASAMPFMKELEKRHPDLEVRSLEVFNNEDNLELLKKMAEQHGTEARGIPMVFIGDRYFTGFSEGTAHDIETEVKRITEHPPGDGDAPSRTGGRLELPLVGPVDSSTLSLPVFTIVVAGLDSFNPCAFFVLLFLLSLLVHAHSRQRMLVIGGIFVIFSGLVYFVYMAAWLNLFLLLGELQFVTVIAGMVALIIALINIKDFFFFKKGVSLAIPERAKPRLFERMRNLVHTGSLPGMVAATVILALAANTYEVFCTAGFPMLYTRALTLERLPLSMFYLYLLLYNVVYIIPLACIVVLFVVSLGSRKLSEWQGRVLKLLSGVMMLGLALVLLVRPYLLNNAIASIGLLVICVSVTGLVALAAKRFGSDTAQPHDGV
ncbi:MAG: hypothetical protein A2X58_02270 [Nitrospirae bacterium GWC2_56_14]|nr:MAG: hypothetical protein A2X58_02270 [Nitrospirae bacterium GWC2_56_14]